MTRLVPEMAEDCAIGLAHRDSNCFSHSIVGFRERNGNHARLVPSHHFWSRCRIRRTRKEIKDERFHIATRSTRQRQIEIYQTINEAPLRRLDFLPSKMIHRVRNVGNNAVVAARRAERLRAVGRHHPVAPMPFPVRAEPIAAIWCRQGNPVWSVGPHSTELPLLREITEFASAPLAIRILKHECLAAWQRKSFIDFFRNRGRRSGPVE